MSDYIADLLLMYDAKRRDIWIILSKDRSTILQDPGMSRPWFAKGPHARKVAEAMAKRVGHGCCAAEMSEALPFILKHPKNMPSGKN